MESSLEKQALSAKLLKYVRHPLNKAKRTEWEHWFRNAKFDKFHEGLMKKKILLPLKADKGVEKATRFIFFPKKRGSLPDPVRSYAPRAAGKKAVELVADNPEAIAASFIPVPGASLAYLGGKSALYKALNIPTPSHIRHLREKKRYYDIVKSTAIGAGLAGSGIAGHQALKSRQERSNKVKRREELRNSRKALTAGPSRTAKRAEMYKSAAEELQKIAVVKLAAKR